MTCCSITTSGPIGRSFAIHCLVLEEGEGDGEDLGDGNFSEWQSVPIMERHKKNMQNLSHSMYVL